MAEGRIVRIEIDGLEYDKANSGPMQGVDSKDIPIVVRLAGDYGYYIKLYDHRQETIAAYWEGGWESYWDAFDAAVPCLGGFRRKGQTLYTVLVDIGTPNFRDGAKKRN